MAYQWYSFSTDDITHVSGCRFSVRTISVLAWTMETARGLAACRIPDRHRITAWWEGITYYPDISCNMCGGPFSFETGNFEPEKGRCWCGPCAKEMFAFLKAQSARRVRGSIRFYDHAFPPPDIDTSGSV